MAAQHQKGTGMADCPHIVSSREGTHYCDLAKQSVDTLTAELTALRARVAELERGVPDGWQMVPKEPTEEMIQKILSPGEQQAEKGSNSNPHYRIRAASRYREMLRAAPAAPSPPAEEKKA